MNVFRSVENDDRGSSPLHADRAVDLYDKTRHPRRLPGPCEGEGGHREKPWRDPGTFYDDLTTAP